MYNHYFFLSLTDGGPGLSEEYIVAMFVAGIFFSSISPLFLGTILDSYGPRTCSMISFLFLTFGCILFAISNIPNFPMFIPGFCLISFAGPGINISSTHLSYLYPKNKQKVTSLLSVSYQLSIGIFFLFDQLWFLFHYDYQRIFVCYAVFCFFNIFLSFFIFPDTPYSSAENSTKNNYSILENVPEEDSSENVPRENIPRHSISEKIPRQNFLEKIPLVVISEKIQKNSHIIVVSPKTTRMKENIQNNLNNQNNQNIQNSKYNQSYQNNGSYKVKLFLSCILNIIYLFIDSFIHSFIFLFISSFIYAFI